MFSKYISLELQTTIYPSTVWNRHGLLQLLTPFSLVNRIHHSPFTSLHLQLVMIYFDGHKQL